MIDIPDFAIIGSGILGLSIGNSLIKKFPSSKVTVYEKESEIGLHASGRNSGVLHAGFYYTPDSLKAKFCSQGNLEIRKLIKKHNIPILETGKVVVAKNPDEVSRLEILFKRGLENGVSLELLDAHQLRKIEPLASTYKNFLWSPNTAVSYPVQVLHALRKDFEQSGGKIETHADVKVNSEGKINVNGKIIQPKLTFNCAGTSALDIAQKLGCGRNYSQLPVLGRYRITSKINLPLKTLIYPVPNPSNPFLGVHFTVTPDGSVKIGPTAIPVVGRDQYSFFTRFTLRDLASSAKGIFTLFTNSPKNLTKLAFLEYPKLSDKRLISEGKKLVPTTPKSEFWKPKQPGIRAQLINLNTKEFEQDFVIEKSEGFVHVLNAVSPGWTAAIPFAEWLVDQVN